MVHCHTRHLGRPHTTNQAADGRAAGSRHDI
jgi:hypothetical protein